jgi:hypothetical protein
MDDGKAEEMSRLAERAPRQVHDGCQNFGTVVIFKARDTLKRLAFWRAGRMLPRLAVK